MLKRVSLNGDLERSLSEAVKLKLELPCRPQDVGDARAMGHLLRKPAKAGNGTSP